MEEQQATVISLEQGCEKGNKKVEQQATVIPLEEGREKGNKKVEQQATVISFEQGWETIQKGIKKVKDILEGLDDEVRPGSDEYMLLYTAVYNLCTQKPPHEYTGPLYDKYRESLEDYITSTVLPSLTEQHDDELMLRGLVRRWANYKVMVKWLSHFFWYTERFYIPRRSLPTLNDAGLACFRGLVYEEKKVKARDVVIFLIGQEREGKQIDRYLLKNVVEIFVDMGLDHYEEDLEDAILRETAAFYSSRASCWILEDSCPVYMLKAEDCLKLEKDRVFHYLKSSSEPNLLKTVNTELISVYAAQLLEMEGSGCSALLQKNEVNNLSLMYRLFSEVDNGLVLVSSKFKQHITAEGMAVVNQAGDIASKKKTENKDEVVSLFFVQKTIELHHKYLEYVHDCFQNHAQFLKALREALDVICNKTIAGLSSAELFATFCDSILQKGGRRGKLSDEAIEETMENMVNLVLFISDKDLFSEFCRKNLAKRLLCDKGADADRERSLLSKLKRQCGGQFTSKMECMLNDLTLSREIQVNFREYLHSNPCAKPSTNFTVTVLTRGCWPNYKSSNLNLPAEMVKCVEAFGDYYQMGTKHRKLTWTYSLGNCILNGKFGHKTIEMVATTHQALVLLLYNDSDRLSYSEIMSQLNLTDDEIVRLLHSLCFARYNILNKEPKSKSISPTDYFEFNSDFTDKSKRIQLPHHPVDDEKRKAIEDVGKERVYSIDASLVRIMKGRKVLSHQQLVIECVQQLSHIFKPDVKVIKKQIEDLILREFLERDNENPKLYKYLA